MSIPTSQRGFRFIGLVLQTFGGAMNWLTLAIFMFSGMSAWSSPAMLVVRTWLPWLSFPVFLGILCIAILFLMALQHKYAQPSIMVYWNRMFWEQDNPMRKAMEKQDKRLKLIQRKLGITDEEN